MLRSMYLFFLFFTPTCIFLPPCTAAYCISFITLPFSLLMIQISFGYCRSKCMIPHARTYWHISHHLVSCLAAFTWSRSSVSVIHHPTCCVATTTCLLWSRYCMLTSHQRFHSQPLCIKLVPAVCSDHSANTMLSMYSMQKPIIFTLVHFLFVFIKAYYTREMNNGCGILIIPLFFLITIYIITNASAYDGNCWWCQHLQWRAKSDWRKAKGDFINIYLYKALLYRHVLEEWFW